MEVTVGTAALAVALLALPLLYERCGSFRYFCKMGFYNGWILVLAVVAIPLCALRGRDVENMKILRALLQHVKHLYGIRMGVRGAQHLPPRQPYVVVSNHQSSLDLLGMMEVLPDRCVPIAKRELLYMGAVGLACWLGGIIFIDRKRPRDAIGVLAQAADTMLRHDVRVWVFPEGTRNHEGSMLPFKRGAFHLAVQAQVPVVPIVISSYRHFYSKRERRFTAGESCGAAMGRPWGWRGRGEGCGAAVGRPWGGCGAGGGVGRALGRYGAAMGLYGAAMGPDEEVSALCEFPGGVMGGSRGSGDAVGQLWVVVSRYGAAVGHYGAAVGRSGAPMGRYGAAVGRYGAAVGHYGAAVGPDEELSGWFGFPGGVVGGSWGSGDAVDRYGSLWGIYGLLWGSCGSLWGSRGAG
ncbi:1-acyl-sn-glycerol-3-phosphate acyltransferase alpha isoform X2 [Cuculus canorus]|uniref:1-acyl-sn-glycerol-3-phosphate acyltransferase alpha isoform X2 n=1 Tax=Cuculus canorus TaxID=55661 RepID=UPI0023AA502E|nr:1-acyl-sn-glycerol-3-phosphate acyltransferase alpha isoform X2 [Cuculus canorus]